MSLDRRTAPRTSCLVPVLLRFPLEEPSEDWGTVHDFSPGGMRFEARRSLSAGAVVYLSFDAPGGRRYVNARGSVVRTVRHGRYTMAGVRLDDAEGQRLLDALMRTGTMEERTHSLE